MLSCILIAIVIICILIGAKRGFVRSVLGVVFTFLSYGLARGIAKVVSPMIAGNIPLPGIGTSLATALNQLDLTTRTEEACYTVLLEHGFPEAAASRIASSLDYSGTLTLARQVSSAIDSVVSYVLCFVLALIVVSLASILVTAAIDGLMKLPVLHIVNVLAGALTGAVLSIFALWLLCLAANWASPLLDACFSTEISTWLHADSLFNLLCKTNLFTLRLP